MTQVAARRSFAERIGWEERVKPTLNMLLVAALGLLAGLYILGPMRSARQPTHLPVSLAAMPSGAVQVSNPDGSAGLLPVRVADSSANRAIGFKGVGEQAIDNQFLLYALTRETTTRASYSLEGFRSPVEFAVIGADGTVKAVREAPVGAQRVSIAEPHRWLLAAEAGTLARFGVVPGSQIDPEGIRKF